MNRDEWNGGVRYGAPPKPSGIPTPAELQQEAALKLEPEVREIVGRTIDQLRKTKPMMAVAYGSPRALAVAAERLRAAGWMCTIDSDSDRDGPFLQTTATGEGG